MAEGVIRVEGLRKSYGQKEAVRGVSFTVDQGEVFALLGPNGAGKTTTVEILEGHRQRTSGDVEVLGHNPARNERRFKERIGIVLQRTGVEPYLTVEETVEQFRGYYPHPRPLDEVLMTVGLTADRKTLVRKLSGGQQRRLDVAVGLAGDPDLLFLDEPTTGFDPAARRDAWDMVKNLQALGKTVFLTTHYLDEAEQLATRVAIIVGGEIVAEGRPRELSTLQHTTAVTFGLPPQSPGLPQELAGMAVPQDGRFQVQTQTPTHTLYLLTRWANEHGLELLNLTVTRPSLEDVYLQLVRTDGTTEETP